MNEGKPVVAERFSRTLKNLFMSKFMNTWLQYQKKYILINQMRQLINTTILYHRKIKMKHVDVGPSIYIGFYKSINDKDPKFKVSDNVKMSKYENIFAKAYFSNSSEEAFMFKKI